MADFNPSTNYYVNLGGVNEKASEYSVGKAQFLSLRNVDFQVPNALQKRPGSTQAIGLSAGTSGPIRALFEFERLQGASYIVTASDTALFYVAANAYTLLSTGWNNGQPPDMLTFVNKLWVANGQKFISWDGGETYGVLNAGLLTTPKVGFTGDPASAGGATWFLVAGDTHIMDNSSTASLAICGVWLAYSYVRSDGLEGPIDFMVSARQLIGPKNGQGPEINGSEWFSITTWAAGGQPVSFTTMPAGVTALNLWLAFDRVLGSRTNIGATPIQTGASQVGNGLSLISFGGFRASAFKDDINPLLDTTSFKFYTSIPSTTATFLISGLNRASFIASNTNSFSGVAFDWFATNTPKYIEVNQNVMFMAGFSNAPSLVWFSDVGTPEIIQPENNFEVRTNDGDRIYGTKAYNNQLIIMKERSFHKVIGDNPENFELVELSTQYGCISNKSVVEFRESLLWLDRQGVVEFNGSTWEIISTPVEDTFRRMNLSAAKEKAVGVHIPYRNQVWFGIPVDGSTQNNLTVVYDYFVGGWTFYDGFNPASFAFNKGALAAPSAWMGDYSGLIHYFGESLYGDNGRGITCTGFTPFEKGQENETHLWRRFFLDVSPVSGITGVINCQLFSNYNRSTVQGTFAIYQDQFQSRADFGLPAKSAALQFSHHSASLPLLINGYSWTKRFLRNV